MTDAETAVGVNKPKTSSETLSISVALIIDESSSLFEILRIWSSRSLSLSISSSSCNVSSYYSCYAVNFFSRRIISFFFAYYKKICIDYFTEDDY